MRLNLRLFLPERKGGGGETEWGKESERGGKKFSAFLPLFFFPLFSLSGALSRVEEGGGRGVSSSLSSKYPVWGESCPAGWIVRGERGPPAPGGCG